jgi:hypothetical protein
MRAGAQHHCLVFVGRWQGGQIEAVRGGRKGARRPRGKTAEIEGQPVAQQLEPFELPRPVRFVTGNCDSDRGRVSRDRIMTYADRGQPICKSPDRVPVGPFAFGKQQMQLGVMSALRL